MLKRVFPFFIALIMSIFSIFGNNSNNNNKKPDDNKLPDFNFPKDVIRDSEAQLKEALAKGDGISVVDALVKFSLANSSISDETFESVVKKVYEVIDKEKQPDTKALLYFLLYKIYDSHEDAIEAETCYKQAIENENELKKYKIADYTPIIKSDEIGRRLCPTLYDFLRYKKDGTSYIYSILEEGEMEGFRIKDLYCYEENYQTFVDYVEKYPNSVWTNDIKNNIVQIEKQDVSVDYKEQIHSGDPIEITINSTNAKELDIVIYRFPDDTKMRSFKRKDLEKSVSKHVTFETDKKFFRERKQITLDPLPLGNYHVDVVVNGQTKNDDLWIQRALRIKDTSVFSIDEVDKDSILNIVVDTKNGEEVSRYFEKKRVFSSRSKSENKINILTDLAIYRPGETLRYTAFLSYADIHKTLAKENCELKVTFYDTNRKVIGQQTQFTDKFGQIKGEFAVPTDLTNGEFLLEIRYDTNDYSTSTRSSKYITVSEYKTPTFYVDMEENPDSYEEDKDIDIKGKCLTYSGIPVVNREVRVEIKPRYWFWYRGGEEMESIYLTTKTDESGYFCVIINHKEHVISGRTFEVSATVTDEAGESQSGDCKFYVGRVRGLEYAGQHDFIVDKGELHIPIMVNSSDPDDNDFVINYTLASKDDPTKIIKSGSIKGNDFIVDFRDVKSGTYIIKAELEGTFQSVEEEIILYHKKDTSCPVKSALWKPSEGSYIEDNGLVHVKLGTAYHSHVYYLATSRTGVVSHGWIDYTPGMNEFVIRVPEGDDQYISLSFQCYYEGKLYTESAYFNHSQSLKRIYVGIESFRNKIVPGTKETWKFTLKDYKDNPIEGRLALEIISEAVDHLRHNSWSCNNYLLSAGSSRLSGTTYGYSYSYGGYIGEMFTSAQYNLPELHMYYQRYKWGSYSRNYDLLDGAMPMPMVAMESAAVGGAAPSNMRTAEAPMMKNSMVSSEAESNKEIFNAIGIRADETKVALWEPMIDFAEDGTVTVEFQVPSDNTTWILNAIGTDKENTFSYNLSKKMIASRALMVKPSLPRFLRSGDKTTLMANVQNGTEEEIKADVIIELFDPRTDRIIASKEINVAIAASNMTAVGIPCEVNDNLPFVGFRIKAAANGSGDGEQVKIPVLSSVAPVVETIPFYLNPNDGDTIIDISRFPETSKITFEYCNNPVWYCLYALPTIYDEESMTATGLMHNLYAVTLAKGLCDTNPLVAEALKKIHEDAENGVTEKKNAVPFDQKTAKKIIKELCKLQNSDGGLSWFDWEGRESSEYVTYSVLELIGELRQLGYEIEDSDLHKLEKRALDYYEKEQIKNLDEMKKWAKETKSKVNYAKFDSYLYLRTLFPANRFSIPRDNAKLLKNTLEAVEDNWRDFSLPTRGFVALSLFRNNRVKTARLIMESMRQFAVDDPRRGMFWDNLQTFGYRFVQRTALTALMLEAFNEIDPREEELNQIRKWMLLEKQTTDWGTSSMASEATFALLTTGSEWLRSSESEYYRKEITDFSPIKVTHENGVPAWGAVYAKFPSKITETKAFKLQEIEIIKELRKHDGGKVIDLSDIHVGDKLQVCLTINTDRDMQYVTIKDNRAACFEPVDKTSGYQFSDSNIKNRQSMGYYNNIKDTENRIMINFLPKGSHIITYDVYVTNAGEFCTGLAEVTCEYAEQFTAHTAGDIIIVKE